MCHSTGGQIAGTADEHSRTMSRRLCLVKSPHDCGCYYSFLPIMWYRISTIRSLLYDELSAFSDLERQVWMELRAETQSNRPPRQVYDYCECEYHNDCPRGPPGKRGTTTFAQVQNLSQPFSGADGEDGLHGESGAPGLPGAPGILPEALYQHIDGCMICPYGPKGKQGEPGPPGPQGVPGFAGKDGRNGIPGANGSPGEAGPPGASGEPGRNGEPGTPGLDGVMGIKGLHGEPGEPGQQGYKGEPGKAGEPGKFGLSRSSRTAW
ncbi:collagen triple helix repeat protein [Ostertagia ostertagi]